MQFRTFNNKLKSHVKQMMKEQTHLFLVDLEPEVVWNTYLDSFPAGTNEVFRERREYDCSCCRHFIRDMGRLVTIKKNEVTTIWDFETGDEKYQPVINALSALIKSAVVRDVAVPVTRVFGTEKNTETTDSGVHTWYHFFAQLPSSVKIFKKDQVGTIQGRMRDVRNVFERSLKEIDSDAVDTVLELIGQKSLYKGEEWKAVLTQFKKIQKAYKKVNAADQANFCWEQSVLVGPVIGKIKNHSIGVLLSDISEGMNLDKAVRRYEAIVAPSNYKRPKAIFTKKMIEQAKKTVQELGFENSLARRYAEISDITVNNILFANRNATKAMSGDAFDDLAASVPSKPKNLSKVEEISIEDFVENVMPNAKEIEVLLENEHESNMVSLIAPQDRESKSMLKWNNNFSWAYSGNITDSMKERVKSFGGKVDGVLRFSIQWNDNNDCPDDLDAHSIEPNKNHIHFANKRNGLTGGNLDVDITHPNKVAVENITWPSKSKMKTGTYKFFVHNYANRGGKSGFTAEIEFEGKIYSFSRDKPLRQGQRVQVAEVDFDGDKFTIREKLSSSTSSKEIWGLSSNNFHPVTVAMNSPNYWDEQEGIGHKHYFFMLDSCVNPDTPNGFFNEFLNQDLMKHKRVFEALGSKMRVEETENQLSGLGFSSTKRAQLVVRVKGSFDRLLKIKF